MIPLKSILVKVILGSLQDIKSDVLEDFLFCVVQNFPYLVKRVAKIVFQQRFKFIKKKSSQEWAETLELRFSLERVGRTLSLGRGGYNLPIAGSVIMSIMKSTNSEKGMNKK